MRGKAIVAMCLLAVLSAAPAARAQAPCSIQTVMGTYAVQSTSWSAIGDVSTIPTVGQVYTLLGFAYTLVGTATVAADGTGTGVYWGVLGATPTPLTGIPFQFAVTVNPDCTGELTEPGAAGAGKFVIINNGAEIRSIFWEDAATGVGTWRRITRADDPAPSCGQHTVRGTYTAQCVGYDVVMNGDAGQVTTSTSLLKWTAAKGSLFGTEWASRFTFPPATLTETIGLSGTYIVHPDCTMDVDFTSESLPSGLVMKVRGVVFDQGKQGYGIPMGVYNGEDLVLPMGPHACELVRLGNGGDGLPSQFVIGSDGPGAPARVSRP